jgi:hypothetical protein
MEEWVNRLLKEGMSKRSVAIKTGLSRRKVGQIADQLTKHQDDIFATGSARKSALKTELYQEIHALACRPGGVKRSELSRQLADLFGYRLNGETGRQMLNMTKDQYQYLKTKVKRIPYQGDQPLFVPEWMPRSNPTTAWEMLLQAANMVLTKIDEQIAEICHSFPELLPKSIRQELLSIAIDGYGPQPVAVRCDRNVSISWELSERTPPCPVEPLESRPLEDPELDLLCA